MKKKPATKTTAVSHEQLHAIRRLANAGKVDEALERLDKLIALHPGHKPLYGLAWEIADMIEKPHQAVGRALDWAQVSPNSRAAWEALSDNALAGGYFALGMFAHGKLAALTGEASETLEDLETPFGIMRFEEALANDTARVRMATGHYDAARQALAGFDHVSLRNNDALARFHQGDVRGALVTYEENWQREPRNLFALERMVCLRLWTRGLDAASGLATPLKTTPAARSDDAFAKINALLILGDWQGADTAWRESAEADFWQGPQEIAKSGAFDFSGAVAALRLGDFESMAERLDDAAENLPERHDLIRKIGFAAAVPGLGESPDIALGELNYWFPQRWIDRLFAMKELKGKQSEDFYDALMRECDAHPDYLGVVAEFGGESGRFFATSILKLRAREGDEAARQALIALLIRPCGPDKARTNLHADMVEDGLLPEGGTVSMWAQGQLREIRHMAMKIHAEASSPNLPPESHARLEKVFDLIAKKRLQDCIPILDELIGKHPDNPLLYNNLAGIKEGLGHPAEDIETLLQQAHTLDPDYLFAIAGLARLAARRGEIEKAKAMIDPLLDRKSYHFTEWRSILMTQVELAKAQGEFTAAVNLQNQIVELQKQFG